jgi:hypothetical protein
MAQSYEQFYARLMREQANFLIHAKIYVMSFGMSGALHEELYSQLITVYKEDRETKVEQMGSKCYILPKNDRERLIFERHESGPEIYLLPLVSFIGVAAVSGVVGGLAYDLLKKLYENAQKALLESIKQEKRKGRHKEIDDRFMDHLLEITLYLPDGKYSVRFDPKQGLPPEAVKLLTRKIKQYQKSQDSKK